MIQHELLLKTQNEERNYIGPGLLLYYKKMPAYLLVNQYTPLGIINDVRAIIHKVVLYLNSKNISSDIIKTNKKQ